MEDSFMYESTPKRRSTSFTPSANNNTNNNNTINNRSTMNTGSAKPSSRMVDTVSSPTTLKESPIRGSNSYYNKTPKRRANSTSRRAPTSSMIDEDPRDSREQASDDFAKFLSPTGEKIYRKLSEEAELQQQQQQAQQDFQDEETEFREFQKLLEKSKMNMERGGDEDDSVRLLRQQLTQVQQIKFENQKKQKIINDLQRQVDDLLQYRDDSVQLRNEVNILRERARGKEEEVKRIESEANDRITTQKGVEKQLREELLQLQQVLTEEKAKRDVDVSQLKKEVDQTREEVVLSANQRVSLEKELLELSVSLKEQNELQDKKTKNQKELAEKLQEQIGILLNTRTELTERMAESEMRIKKGQKVVEDKDLEIDKLKRKIDRLELEKQDQGSTLNQLQNSIISLQDKVTELNVEENLVTELKKDLSIIPELKNEIQTTRKRLEDTQNQLDKEYHGKQLVTEELRKMNEINDNLEAYVGDLKDENDQLKDRLDDLSKVKAENDFLQRELSHYKETSERLTEQYNSAVSQRDLKESEVGSAHGSLASEFYALMKTVEHVLEGHEYNRNEDDSQLNKKALDAVKPNYKALKSKVLDSLDDIIVCREKCRILQDELDGLSSNFQNLNHDHSDTYKELINLKKQLSDSEKVNRALKEQKQELEDSVNELEELLDSHQEEEKNRLRYVYSLYKMLKDTPTNEKRNGSPLRGRPQSSEIDEPISWETFQSLFSEQVTAHLVERESLKKEVATQKEKIVDLNLRLDEANKAMKANLEKYEAERTELEKNYQSEIDEQRSKLEHQIEMMELDYSEKVKELEDALRETQEQLSETTGKLKKTTMIVEVLKTELRDSQIDQNKLHNGLKLLARGIRPMKDRIDNLKLHKSVLKSQLKQYERLVKGVYETVKSLSTEFEVVSEFEFPREYSSEKPKTSFRAAVLAVIIGNRFNKLLVQKRKEKEGSTLYYTVGGDRLALLAPECINDNREFQIPLEEYKGSVHAYLQLVSHLDSEFDEPREDLSLMRSLHDGLQSTINRQLITGYKFNAKEAISTPIKKQLKNIVHSSPQKRGLAVVQQTTVGVVKSLRELKSEKAGLQKKCLQISEEVERVSKRAEEMEDIIKKKSELVSFMENRINDLEEENLNLIEPEKFEMIKKEVEKLRSNYTTVQFEKEQFKQEFESQLSQLNQYRSDLQELQDQLHEKTQKLDSATRELELKREECSKLFNTSKKTTEMLSELEREKSKYENMVSDLRQKLFKKPKEGSLFSDSDTLSNSSSMSSNNASKYNNTVGYNPVKPNSVLNTTKEEPTPKSTPSAYSSISKQTPTSAFGSVKKKVERDLSASHKIMKTLNESNAKTSREVQELDKELKNARAHLAELQNSLSLSTTSPARKIASPSSTGRSNKRMTVEEILNRSTEFDYEELGSSSSTRKNSNSLVSSLQTSRFLTGRILSSTSSRTSSAVGYHTTQIKFNSSEEDSDSTIGKYTFAVNEQVEQFLKKAQEKHQVLSQSVYSGQTTKNSQFIELKWLSNVVELKDKYENLKTQLSQLREMMSTEKDPELKQLAKEEYSETEIEYSQSQERLISVLLNAPQLSDNNSDGGGSEHQISPSSNAIIEIRPGTGGEEASLFAMELFKMYEFYATRRGWKFEVLSLSANCGGEGCKEGIALISGSSFGGGDESGGNNLGVFGCLKFESGVHRVQRVPATESQGRVHTSSASIVVLPEVTEADVKINLADVRIDTMRASGAGGQHVNTTDSAVRLTHIPTGIVVCIADERSQHRNKEKAFKILHSRIFKKQQDEKMQKMSSERKEQIGSGDRSDKIRTYNFPQDRITDHRISFSQFGLDKMMEGEILDSFFEILAKQEKIQQFERLFEKKETVVPQSTKKKK